MRVPVSRWRQQPVPLVLSSVAICAVVAAVLATGGGSGAVHQPRSSGRGAGADRPVASASVRPTLDGRTPATGRLHTARAADPLAAWRGPLDIALLHGVEAAEGYGGLASAAIWVQGWPGPVVHGDASRLGRLWSVSKPVTAIAAGLLTSGHFGQPLYGAMTDAITRSDNCAQRRVVLGLQQLAGSKPRAVNDFTKVLELGSVTLHSEYQIGSISEDQDCIPYLQANRGTVSDPLQPALEFGVYTWNVVDAVSFAHALAIGTYGRSGSAVLHLMRLPKQYALAPTSHDDYTSALDRPPSGGDFPASWRPGYKGGWGGSQQGDFLAEQIVDLDLGGHAVSLAAMFWPSAPAPSDDPGRGVSPAALEALLSTVRMRLEHLAPPSEATG